MGRDSTGALTTKECIRLELKYLKDSKLIQKNRQIESVLSWSSGAKMGFQSVYTDEDKYIKLNYYFKSTDQKIQYKIRLREVPSNLGKGNLLYMVCPLSGLKSRKLYLAYGSTMFKNIKAYNNRIYYPSQITSKTDRYNTKYWALLRELEREDVQRNQQYYNGALTKRAEHINRQYELLDWYDQMRWVELSPKLRALASAYGLF